MKPHFSLGPYYLIFFITGFTSIAAQILFVREFFSLFIGDELFLGSFFAFWLMWTALGGYLAGKPVFKAKNISFRVGILQSASAFLLPLTLFALRRSLLLWRPAAGELPGFLPTLLTSVILLAPFCLINGALFSAGSRLLRSKKQFSPGVSAGTVYWVETASSALGGLLMAAVMVSYFRPALIISLLSALNLASAFFLFRAHNFGRYLTAVLGILLLVTLPYWGAFYNMFPGFQLLRVKDSPYGRLTVLRQAENTIVLENGRMAFSRLDKPHAEFLTHAAMLLNNNPKRVLFIGGGFSDAVSEALKYHTLRRLDYVELDPAVLEIGRRYFPDIWRQLKADKRVHIFHDDGRRFLKSAKIKYDVIIIDLPDPLNAQLNRFYTVEFFREINQHLQAGGLFSFYTRGAENYFSPPLARLVSCEFYSLRAVFKYVTLIPGNPLYYLAANDTILGHFSAQVLIKRLRQKKIKTSYFNAAFLPYRLSADRLTDLKQTVAAQRAVQLNSDLKPQAYYYNLTLQGAQSSTRYAAFLRHLLNMSFGWYLILILLPLLLFYFVGKRRNYDRQICLYAGYSVFTMGFSVMALEIILLILYQIAFGSLYLKIALLIAAFMSGMAAGSLLFLRRMPGNLPAALILLHGGSVASVILLFVLTGNGAGEIYYFLLAAIIGLTGGAVFPLAAKLYFTSNANLGAPYSLDLAGAFLGSLLFSSVLIPLYGFYPALWLLILLNLSVSALFGTVYFKRVTLLRKQKR